MTEKFHNELEKCFPIEKIKNDLLSYFEIINFSQFSVIITSSHEINGSIRDFVFDSNDSISIESIHTTKKYLNQLYLPFRVCVIIGNFKESLGVTEYEKFCCEMFYDYELELTTIDVNHILE